MSAPEPRDALVTAEGLRNALTGMAKELKRVRSHSRHNRWFILLDIVLTVGLAVTSGIALHAVQQAARADSAQLALCRAGNVSRAEQDGLWMFLIHLSAPPKTAQARKVLTEFEHHLKIVFRPRNCARLGQPGGPATSTAGPRPSSSMPLGTVKR